MDRHQVVSNEEIINKIPYFLIAELSRYIIQRIYNFLSDKPHK
jgi:hypothetical protein